MHVAVIGAGAFGGWTALHLQSQGVKVTLIDSWGAGNSLSSSGGETRIIRSTYGEDRVSSHMARRSLQLWKEHEKKWNLPLFYRTGALFLGGPQDEFISSSARMLQEHEDNAEILSRQQASSRYPQINFDGVDSLLFEPDAGFLTARQNCRTVLQKFVEGGGNFEVAKVSTQHLERDVTSIRLSNGSDVFADYYIFACGSWLPILFPDVLAGFIRPTKQEVLFVGVPPGNTSFNFSSLPCWADRTSDLKYYGIPNFEGRGFKLSPDLRGQDFNPDTSDRLLGVNTWAHAKDYLRFRFPALATAPLLESRICHYENTPDLGFLIDGHPMAKNVMLVGGGSGHGYKSGPAVGEYVAGLILQTVAAEPAFRLKRLPSATSAIPCSF